MEGGDEPPREDARADVDMWRDEAVEEDHPLEGNVRDIECGQEPGVLRGGQREGGVQAGDSGVANVAAVEEAEHVEEGDEEDESAVELPEDGLLFGVGVVL